MDTITSSLKQFIDGEEQPRQATPFTLALSTETILEKAMAEGITLMEYVARDPDKAVKEAEAQYAQWVNIQTSVVINGGIETEEGYVALNKNTTRVLQDRVEAAQKLLDRVYEYTLTAYKSNEQRRDHIVRVLYNKAVYKNDTKAMMYLIDRLDGRPTEARDTAVDMDNAYNVYQIIHTMFDKQLEVLNSGVGTKLVCCSRRAGKTRMSCSIILIEALRRPNTTCIYIGETMELTEQLIDGEITKIVDECKLTDKKGKRLNWRRLDNGSKILVRGLSNTKDPDLIRGNSAKVIIIDEFFHLKGDLLEYLHREVLQPMQLDYADDYMFICVGTPPSIKNTFGEYAWKNWKVPHFFWTYRDNPHPVNLEARDAYVENILKEKGLTWDSAFARREYRGEWAYDDDLLLYPDYCTYDPREQVPNMHVDQVLFGIDYGVGDNDTLIGIAWNTANRCGYIFHEDKFNRLSITDRTISQLQYLKGQVKYAWQSALELFPQLSAKEANKRILWDADDNDQHVTDELNVNVRLDEHPEIRLNISNAHKTDKIIIQDKIAELMRTGSLLLIKDGKTADECDKTVLKRGPNGQVYPEIDDRIYHPDLLPALRYALWNVIGQEVRK